MATRSTGIGAQWLHPRPPILRKSFSTCRASFSRVRAGLVLSLSRGRRRHLGALSVAFFRARDFGRLMRFCTHIRVRFSHQDPHLAGQRSRAQKRPRGNSRSGCLRVLCDSRRALVLNSIMLDLGCHQSRPMARRRQQPTVGEDCSRAAIRLPGRFDQDRPEKNRNGTHGLGVIVVFCPVR